MQFPEVLHVRSSAGLYGAEYVVLGLIPELDARGISGSLLCLDNPHLAIQQLYERALSLDVRAERIPCSRRFDPGTVRALKNVIARHPGIIVHVHDYKSALHGWLAVRGTNTPIVATSHGQFATSLRLGLYNRLELWLMRGFDAVCIVSEAMYPVLAAAGIPRERVIFIENGIDTHRFRPDVAPLARRDFGLDDNAFLFGSAMRLTAQKNPLGAIDAFADVTRSHSHARLVIAGDGPLRASMEARIRQEGLGARVRLVGARDDLERFYPMLDAFVLPSLYEGLPLALLEAMAAECPLVVTNVGQIAAVIEGLPAECVQAGDLPALSSAMERVMLQPQCTSSLRERVIERFSVSTMATAYAALYGKVWKDHGRAAA